MSRRNSFSRSRTRRDSGTKLDHYYEIVNSKILTHQNPVTGLLAASDETDHSWVRDNVYSIMSVWALALAYKKHADKDFGRARAYELESSVIKLMRGLLMAMMLQIKKVEKFKYTNNPGDSLHAKYSSKTCMTVVGDKDWGHLQIDATSLYLLMLAEMTASGLQIIFTLDEVSFIQNLIFYIEYAFLIPDYGIWERGDKTNHGNLELNASSIGMAKSALVAMDELDLFGSRGGDCSIIHVLPDTINWCNTILTCMLPRESNSKETDAALLSIISYPAFALDNIELVNLTRNQILTKLQGRYGCSRFIRDGYKTAKEDPSRLHYEPWELKVFENIECEWPLFWCYLILDGIFYENEEQVRVISANLENVLIKDESGIKQVPELYAVPVYKVEEEYRFPHSQDRVPLGKLPHTWGQSLYIISKLLTDDLIAPGEIDPLNKRLVIQPKPDLVVQICVLMEDEQVQQQIFEDHNIYLETVSSISPVKIYPSKALAHLYSFLGKNDRLGLTGRPVTDIGYLATAKLYSIKGQIMAFTPSFMDHKSFYLASDLDYSLDLFRTYIEFIEKNWSNIPGRPLIVFLITNEMYEAHKKLKSALITTIRKLNSGYINGARVQLGKIQDFIKTSCLTNLAFLGNGQCGKENEKHAMEYIKSLDSDEKNAYKEFLIEEENSLHPSYSSTSLSNEVSYSGGSTIQKTKKSKRILGIVKRTRSIHHNVLSNDIILNAAKRPSFAEIFDIESKRVEDIEKKIELQKQSEFESRTRAESQSYHSMGDEDLLIMITHTKTLHEEADILQCLFENKGLDWDVGSCFPGLKLKDLIEKLYEKASIQKCWWLVRHTAGMLALNPDETSKALLNLIIRQKQVSFGIKKNDQNNEKSIKTPMTSDQVYNLIKKAWQDDISMIMVSQEILIYLALFISTEPQLFQGMICIRIGLIIQVMIGELKRTLSCTVEQATDHLLNLSPFEMKTLLHMIISGMELGATTASNNTSENKVEDERKFIREELKQRNSVKLLSLRNMDLDDMNTVIDGDRSFNKHGQWLRRRLLDGSLNRVPIGFYSNVWLTLEKCQGIQIDSFVLDQSLTREMTKEELKFALLVEEALNRIPEPEYRQLIVEACMLMTLLEEQIPKFSLQQIVVIDNIVEIANDLFLTEQVLDNGDATLCCAVGKRCPGARQICEHFYDLAPSGRYGSMNYIFKAFIQLLKIQISPDCIIS